MSTNSSSTGGISIFGLLFVAFLLLKILGIEPIASWSWVWVFSPLWIGFLFVVLMVIIAVILGVITARRDG